MDKLVKLGQDIIQLWSKYWPMYMLSLIHI